MPRFLRLISTILLFSTAGAAYFDVWWHTDNRVESFFTIPHAVLYSGIALNGLIVLMSVFTQLLKIGRFAPFEIERSKELSLAGTGSLLQLLAGGFDFVYHEWVGFDVSIWSPPHLMAVFGGISKAPEFYAIITSLFMSFLLTTAFVQFKRSLALWITLTAFGVQVLIWALWVPTSLSITFTFPVLFFAGALFFDFFASRGSIVTANIINGILLSIIVWATIDTINISHLLYSLLGSIVTGIIGYFLAANGVWQGGKEEYV